jgi:putative ABC transport system ATP-binding protein
MQTAEEKKHKSPAQVEKSEGIEITDLDSFSKEGETEEGSFSFEKKAGEAETAQENDSSSEVLIHMEGITKRFYIGTENELEVLHGISLDVHRGEFTSIVGESGSGKSTLMNLIGLLDHPTSGTYLLSGEDTGEMDDDTLSDLRGQEIGFVFQTYNLIPRMSALKNVEMPMMYARVPQAERTERAERLLELVGMKERMQHNPDELSGGQKQRVAIARAMANDPALILADEPTGALDSKTGHLIMDLFHKLHDEDHRTILLITHSAALAEETARILTLSDGRIIAERRGTRC